MRHRPKPISKAELARLKGVTRGAVTRAAVGPLSAACLPDGRVDLDHPASQKWLGRTDEAKTSAAQLVVHETALTPAELATRASVPLAEVVAALSEPLADAVVPTGHLSASEFSERSGAPLATVLKAASDRSQLAPAVLRNGRINTAHRSALAFAAARPFERDLTGDPIVPDVGGRGFLVPACVGEDIDRDHPIARLYLARCLGYVPSDEELDGLTGAA